MATTKPKKAARKPRTPASVQAPAIPQGLFFLPPAPSNYSGFLGASQSDRRGYVYWPTLDTRAELPQYDRQELLRRARFCDANLGFPKRVIGGMADMIGAIAPSPGTADEEWNKLALERYRIACQNAPVTLDQKHDIYSLQHFLNKLNLRDGDVLPVFSARSREDTTKIAIYESHQIDGNREGWNEGVKLDKHNAATHYRVASGPYGQNGTEISALASLLIANWETNGQIRGRTVLSAALNHILDTTEIIADIKTGIKNANQLAVQHVSQKGSEEASNEGARAALLLQRRLQQTNPATPAPQYPDAPPASVTNYAEYNLEEVFGSASIQRPAPGHEYKILQDSRPHPNQMALIDYLARDISWGAGISPEVIWFVEKLGGANLRFILQTAQDWAEKRRRRTLVPFMTRFWANFAAREMEYGRLRPCQDPEWWKVRWIQPAQMTVDISRDGKLNIELNRAGMLTLEDHYGRQAEDWQAKLRQIAIEAAYKKNLSEEFGIPLPELFPPPNGASNPYTTEPASVDPAASQTLTTAAIHTALQQWLAQNPVAA
jgi:hypothetical protein